MADTRTPLPPSPEEVRLPHFMAYRLLVKWQAAGMGAMLPLVMVVQAMLAVGLIVGFGFLIPGIDRETATFLSTGAPTSLLVIIGLVMVPQAVATARNNGSWNYLRSLPVPRPLLLFSDLTVWLAVALPGLAMALLTAWLRFDVPFSFNWPVLVSAAFLTVLMATSVGYAIAVSLPPMLAQLASQVLVFFVLLFSPLTFPAEQLPEWFQRVHSVLPIQRAGDALRAGLVADQYPFDPVGMAILGVWCLAGLAITLRALTRRA